MDLVPNLEARLARVRGMKRTLRTAAQPIAAKAKARLAAHRDEGRHSIEVSAGAVDVYVDLVGPAAVTVEFGRSGGVREDGTRQGPMEGLRILRGAL